jgi:alkanesulfonate monooxygenase
VFLTHLPTVTQQVMFSPFGEIVANDRFPQQQADRTPTTVD